MRQKTAISFLMKSSFNGLGGEKCLKSTIYEMAIHAA
jgi:hypothetical protein